MQILQQSATVISGMQPMEHIERIGRICYKSEDKIGDGTARKFVQMLFKNNHYAMLEHYRFIMAVNSDIYHHIETLQPKYITMTEQLGRHVISFSARAVIELPFNYVNDMVMYSIAVGVADFISAAVIQQFKCHELFGYSADAISPAPSPGYEFIANSRVSLSDYEYMMHGWRSVHFVTDRGISHEIVRHRDASFAQESTRFCNYGNSEEISVIDQAFVGYQYNQWIVACRMAEDVYMRLLSTDVKPQFARSVLPTCLKTEIVVTAQNKEWEHILNLRVRGTTGAPHPMIKALMEPLVAEFKR